MFDTFRPQADMRSDMPVIDPAAPNRTAPPSTIAFAFQRRENPCGSQCSSCAMRRLCIAASLTDAEAERLDTVITTWRTVAKGDVLLRAGDPFRNLYMVRSGSFKSVTSHASGREHITAFFLPGDTLGLDGICQEYLESDVMALEDSTVCVVPFALLETLCREVKGLQKQFHRMLSAEIVREAELLLLVGSMPAEQRIAAFLLNISRRLRARGFSPTDFTLRMTREDIGNYLGMKLETVSRTFSRFQREGLIRVQGKRIILLDPEALDLL
ncbi:fumarate/nitrate reduction transcriptional regulator Fnr [Cupriavidus campinensis]